VSFLLFSSDAAVCEIYSLVELDILVSLISLSWVARMMKSVSKLMVWLLNSSRVSEGGFWCLEGVLCRRVLRPVLSDMFINVMICKLMRLHDELSRMRAGLTCKKTSTSKARGTQEQRLFYEWGLHSCVVLWGVGIFALTSDN
jgi:hypothetical protein